MPAPIHSINPRNFSVDWIALKRTIQEDFKARNGSLKCECCGLKPNDRIEMDGGLLFGGDLEVHEEFHYDFVNKVAIFSRYRILCDHCHSFIHTSVLRELVRRQMDEHGSLDAAMHKRVKQAYKRLLIVMSLGMSFPPYRASDIYEMFQLMGNADRKHGSNQIARHLRRHLRKKLDEKGLEHIFTHYGLLQNEWFGGWKVVIGDIVILARHNTFEEWYRSHLAYKQGTRVGLKHHIVWRYDYHQQDFVLINHPKVEILGANLSDMEFHQGGKIIKRFLTAPHYMSINQDNRHQFLWDREVVRKVVKFQQLASQL